MEIKELRRKAESRLRKKEKDLSTMSSAEIQQVVHELHTHQIELEMQNEELRRVYDELTESHNRFSDLYHSAPVGYLTINDGGVIIDANRTITEMLGLKAVHIIKQPLHRFIEPDDQDVFYLLRQWIKASADSQHCELRLLSLCKTPLRVRMDCKVERDGDGGTEVMRIAISDITAAKQAEDSLIEQHNLFQSILFLTQDMIYLKNVNFVYQTANPAFCQFLGKPKEEIIGKNDFELFERERARQYRLEDATVMASGEMQMQDLMHTGPKGNKTWFHVIKTPVRDSHGNINGILFSAHDITQRKGYETIISRQANYDALTGLPNRILFYDRLDQALHSAHRKGCHVGLLYIDLDRFKWVNDTLGHEAGDQLLKEATKRLKACSRETDTVARLGGDEFAIILPDIDGNKEAEWVAEKLLAEMNQPYSTGGREEPFISISIGISLYPDDALLSGMLLKNADLAMYQVKRSGRNGFAFFTDEMNYKAHQRISLISELRQAVDNDEFTVHYQPIIKLNSNTLFGAEALLRWRHPDHGLLLPEVFLSVAEESGLIIPMGEYVLQCVVEQARSWQETGLVLPHMALNISARQFKDRDFEAKLVRLLKENDVSPRQLNIDLEITESMILEHVDENLNKLQRIKNMGISLSMDDFGTGYSSLLQLKHFPVSMLKIDRCFVSGVRSDKKDAGLIQGIIAIAHNLGLQVVAEGIETEEQLAFLKDAGCDYGQGYYFSRPVPAEEFIEYCQSVL